MFSADRLPMRWSIAPVLVTSTLTALLLAITAVARLLFGARGLYAPDPATLPAFIGQDAVTLTVILPLLLWSMRAAQRGSLRGLLLWIASLFYVAYSYAYYALNPKFSVLYSTYIAIVSMSLYVCLYLLVSTDADAVASMVAAHVPVRLASSFLIALSLGLGLAWVASILSHLVSGIRPNRVNQVVWPMDLIVLFPAMFWGGVWLWRHQPLGFLVAPELPIKGGLLGVTLALNTWLASTFWAVPVEPAVPIYVIGGVGGLLVALRYLHSVDPPAAVSSRGAEIREPWHEPVAQHIDTALARSCTWMQCETEVGG